MPYRRFFRNTRWDFSWAWKSILISALFHSLAVVALAWILVESDKISIGGIQLKARTEETLDSPILQALADASQGMETSSTNDESLVIIRGASFATTPLSAVSTDSSLAKFSSFASRMELNQGGSGKQASLSQTALGKNGASFFGLGAGGDRFVFVVDCSGSMDGERFRRARKEVRRSIESLYPHQSYFIIFYNHETYFQPENELIPATQKNLQKTIAWLNQAQSGGLTNPLPGMLKALGLKPDGIFLLTDGEFDPVVIQQIQTQQPSPPIPINTIGFTSRKAEPVLRAISATSGGGYKHVK